MGFFDSIFGGNKSNPANAAMPYLNQIPQVAQQNLGPWQQQGQQAQQQNQQQYSRMATDPSNFLQELRASYTPSGGYAFREEQARKAHRGMSSAQGRTSTPENEAALQDLIRQLSAQDEGQYLDRVLGIQGMGLQGNENISNRGYGAAGDINSTLGNTLGAQASLAYKGQENKNATRNELFKLLASLAGGAIGSIGGPAGAAAGASIGGSLAGGGSNGSGQGPTNAQQFGQGLPWLGGNF